MKTTITLIIALLFSNPFVNEAEIEDKSNIEITLATDLFESIRNIDIVSLNIHLAEGANVDTVDTEGNTPLMLAAKVGNPRMARILLAHQPNINAKNLKGETALMIAAENGQYYIARQLIVRGANTLERNSNGLTAEEIAVRNGQPLIVDLLKETRGEFYSR